MALYNAAGSLVLGPQIRVSYDLKQDQTDLGLNRTDLQSIGGKAYLLAKQRHPHLGPITRQWAATTKAHNLQ